jgi:thiosulfate reductase cytochrome b subunit
MVKNNRESSDSKENNTPILKPEIDYSPKKLTLSQQILYGLTMIAIVLLVLGLLCWYEFSVK